MITFNPSTEADIPRIKEWASADIYHKDQNLPEWWVTGNGLLAFVLHDEKGPVFYVRLDDGEYARLSVQFAPVEIVPKRRLVRTMIQCLPRLIEITKRHGNKGLIFDSESPSLISFMEKFGFLRENDRYLLSFGE